VEERRKGEGRGGKGEEKGRGEGRREERREH
jgi:hypothetical protein